MHKYNSGIYKLFNTNRNDTDAVPMKKYMRDQFEFFGIKSVQRKELIKGYLNNHPLPEGVELHRIVKELWGMPERELHYFAIELLMKCKKQWTEKDAPFLEYLIVHKSWWDTVDYLANQVTGPWFRKFPDQIIPVTEKWNTSGNIWLQRMSLLYQLKYKKETNLDLLDKYIKRLSTSKEFFVQKAIGWLLREYAKTNPEFVRKFVASNILMPLSKREALKNID